MSKMITLTRGFVAIVDEDDYKTLTTIGKWYTQPKAKTNYAIRSILINGKRTSQRMHRIIMGALYNEQVDHINGNGLDNRKINLRKVSAKENARNRRPSAGKYKGVCKVSANTWIARISKNRKVEVIGYYRSAKEAAEAYNKEAIKRFGDYAYLNRMR